jgi:hypothetical protein
MGYDAEPKVFGVTQVVACVMIFLLEVNQIHMSFLSCHSSSKQKEGLSKRTALLFVF